MLDFNRIIGVVLSFDTIKYNKIIKDILINIVPKLHSNDLMIMGSKVARGQGEITSLVANYKMPDNSDKKIRALRDAVKTIGELDFQCDKIVFVVGNNFDEDFTYHYNKLMKIAENQNYETEYYFFDLSKMSVENFRDEFIALFNEDKTCGVELG